MLIIHLNTALQEKITSIIERIASNNKKIVKLIEAKQSYNELALINYLNNENRNLLTLLH